MNRFIGMIFWLGFLASANLHGLISDIMGKEQYIKEVNENWIDSSITMPIHIVILAGIFCYLWYIRSHFK